MLESGIEDGPRNQELARDKVDGMRRRNTVAFLVHPRHEQVPRMRRRKIRQLRKAVEAVDKAVIVAIGDVVIPDPDDIDARAIDMGIDGISKCPGG